MLATIGLVALGVMTSLEVTENIEFVVAMALMLAILVGAYLFVITPPKQREEERDTG